MPTPRYEAIPSDFKSRFVCLQVPSNRGPQPAPAANPLIVAAAAAAAVRNKNQVKKS